jgi:glycosyltransferase involved in cell wall biosynthesis
VVSSSIKDKVVRIFNVSPDQITIIPNGVDFQKFNNYVPSKRLLREKYHIPNDKIVILHVGTLNKLKNHIIVLKALAYMDKDLRNKLLYFVVGDGEEKKHLLDFVKKMNLESYVLFIGRVINENIQDMFNMSDFFILSSTSEGFPLVFLEAMSAGLPIITFSDLDGVSDIYHHDSMELITERSTAAIVRSINNAINRTWNKENIKKYVKDASWDAISEKYIHVYKKTMIM